MKSDDEGFQYPFVNIDLCIGCDLCMSVCPVENQYTSVLPISVYAGYTEDDEIRNQSSSGGVFSVIALNVLDKGGKVVGAAFDENWNVKHVIVDSPENLHKLRGSKYVQSEIVGVFESVQELLTKGELVLFSGTPCQVAGLKHYLKEDFGNLITVEVICHGVPSPMIWNDYKNQLLNSKKNNRGNTFSSSGNKIFTNISFRDKRLGWRQFGFSASLLDTRQCNKCLSHFRRLKKEHFEEFHSNIYLNSFLNNYNLRPSCYKCPARSGKSNADIALGDFWKIWDYRPDLQGVNGISLCLCYSKKGNDILHSLPLRLFQSSYQIASASNPVINSSVKVPPSRDLFWNQYKKYRVRVLHDFARKDCPSLYSKIINRVFQDRNFKKQV